MIITNFNKYTLAISLSLILSACGNSNSNIKELSINRIKTFTKDKQTIPTLQNYVNAGVTGVNPENLADINEIIGNLTEAEVDTTQEIQDIVNNTLVPITITHNNVQYGIVTSPISGRIWLDRNIGAKQVCNTPYDIDCYGDYYQWGRNTDGHEKSQSETTGEKGETITDSGDKFVIASSGDWTTSVGRSENWRALDGRSVCPIGYKVPSREDFQSEVINIENKKDQFENFLKLPFAGQRHSWDGSMNEVSESLYYWLNVPHEDTFAYSMQSYSGGITLNKWDNRTTGMSIRCIKE